MTVEENFVLLEVCQEIRRKVDKVEERSWDSTASFWVLAAVMWLNTILLLMIWIAVT